MNVLSLFDGMACGMLAFQKAGIKVDNYDAYEIDKYAIKTTKHNFPNIKEHGDVFTADFTQYKGVDFVIGGSPCTYWSIAQKNNRETEASGMGWELFSQYVRAVKEAEPKYFIYENNYSMSAAIRESINKAFGFEAIFINSALLSAQNRKRLYWVGKRNADGTYSKVDVKLPKDKGILLKDVLDCCKDQAKCVGVGYRNRREDDGKLYRRFETHGEEKANCITTVQTDSMVAEPIRVGALPRPNGELSSSQAFRIYDTNGKSVTINAGGGGAGGKTGLYAVPICHNIPQEVKVRKYTCDIEKFKMLLRENKNKTNKAIAEELNKPLTLVEHWFRKDDCFSVPDADIWFELKGLLNIETNEFDDFVTVFETRDGVFEKANRCYDVNGKMSTLMTSNNDNIIEPTTSKTKSVYEVKNGFITIKGKQYPIKLADGYYIIRKLTVAECKRLQTVPEWYVFPVSDAQAYKMLGNGWTVDVIAHILSFIK